MKLIAIFASGSGSNAENFINYFRESETADIALILTDNKNAKVIDRAKKHGIPVVIFSKEELEGGKVLEKVQKSKIDFIVLAGFLRKIPQGMIEAYPERIVNIHPALLPAYGGKGMYGMKVHEAVVENEETESGVTIHYVNENYDEGDTVFQTRCEVYPDDSAEDVAEKVHELEYQYYPSVVEDLILDMED